MAFRERYVSHHFSSGNGSLDQDKIGFTCYWRIENFNNLNCTIFSPKFRVDMLNQSEWFLSLDIDDGIYLEKCGMYGNTNIGFSIAFGKADGSEYTLYEEERHKFSVGHSCGCELRNKDINRLRQEAQNQNSTLLLIFRMWNGHTMTCIPTQCSIVTRDERHMFNLAMKGFGFLEPNSVQPFPVSCVPFGNFQLDMAVFLGVDLSGDIRCSIRKNSESSFDHVFCKILTRTRKGRMEVLTDFIAKFPEENFTNNFFKNLNINIYKAHKKFVLNNDELILCFEFTTPVDVVYSTPKIPLPTNVVDVNRDAQNEKLAAEKISFIEMDDLLNFFKEKKFCFVTLRTLNKEFAVHKALLCARSPVFRAMFDKNMKENETDIVDIADIDSDTVSLLLKFLHLEPLKDLKWESASKLYYAADKYQIEELKSKCVSFLEPKLTVENLCQAFIMSDMHRDEKLKHIAQKFLAENSKTILCSKEWSNFLMDKTELALEVLRSLTEKL